MNANAFVSGWNAMIQERRKKAEAAGVPQVADRLCLVTAPSEIVGEASFPSDAASFLIDSGLPRRCAPFLSFDAVARGPLPLVEYYGLHQFHSADSSRLASFYVIGSDGAGNPLCLDCSRNGEIVVLDHEDGFRTRTFVAGSVAALAQALLILHTAPHSEFVERLRTCDLQAADPSAFLPSEVEMMIE
jgi:hypothetical protein